MNKYLEEIKRIFILVVPTVFWWMMATQTPIIDPENIALVVFLSCLWTGLFIAIFMQTHYGEELEKERKQKWQFMAELEKIRKSQ